MANSDETPIAQQSPSRGSSRLSSWEATPITPTSIAMKKNCNALSRVSGATMIEAQAHAIPIATANWIAGGKLNLICATSGIPIAMIAHRPRIAADISPGMKAIPIRKAQIPNLCDATHSNSISVPGQI